MPEPIRYDPAVRTEDSDRAAETMRAFLVPDREKPVLVRVCGDCPRCGDQTEDTHWLRVVAGVKELSDEAMLRIADIVAESGADLNSGDEEFEARCRCGVAHKDHPEKDPHCGSRFMMRVVWP